jgi:hypothetical protein
MPSFSAISSMAISSAISPDASPGARIGGGFDSKLFLSTDAVLAALGARAAGRLVKVALTRPLTANNTAHRPATIQRICIIRSRISSLVGCGTAVRSTVTWLGMPGLFSASTLTAEQI